VNFELLFRIWYVLMISHIGFLGVIIECIWNYQPLFFDLLRIYNLYSNFVCISSILNTRFENLIAFLIISGAFITSKVGVSILTLNQSGDGGISVLLNSFYDLSFKLPLL
jgi:hypothetical protein